MVTIRLARSGAKKRPFYHIVVTDRRNRRDGSYIERLGFFNPVAKGQELRLQLDAPRVDHWVKTGAQVSERVKDLMKEVATKGEDGAVKARPRKDPGAKPAPAPKTEETKAEEAKVEAAPAEETKTEEATAEEPKAEAAPAEEAKAEEAPAEEPKAEEAPAEVAKTEEAPAEEAKKAEETAEQGEEKAESAPADGEGDEKQ